MADMEKVQSFEDGIEAFAHVMERIDADYISGRNTDWIGSNLRAVV